MLEDAVFRCMRARMHVSSGDVNWRCCCVSVWFMVSLRQGQGVEEDSGAVKLLAKYERQHHDDHYRWYMYRIFIRFRGRLTDVSLHQFH